MGEVRLLSHDGALWVVGAAGPWRTRVDLDGAVAPDPDRKGVHRARRGTVDAHARSAVGRGVAGAAEPALDVEGLRGGELRPPRHRAAEMGTLLREGEDAARP